ncbi:hypothetical protein ACLQ28_22435 [Micromonospora sp. DT201]|uniref:hypothetical protein n=1 Tax=Micromonospora sp. DT201 TaxID=3393442 RepID=UPI003CF4441A
MTTFSRLQRGPSRRALASVRPDLLIWDDPPSSLPVQLGDQARKVVALVSRGEGQHWAQWPVLLAVDTQVLRDRGHSSLPEVTFEVSREELELRSEAGALLRDLGVKFLMPWSDSLPSLHAWLLARATDAGEDLSARAWAVLDRIENVPSDDDRRDVLRRTLAGVASLSRPCLVVAPTPADAVYTADQLAGLASAPVPIIDATLSAADKRGMLAALAPGQCVVTTSVLDDLWHELPSDCVLVLLPFPDGSGLPGRGLVSRCRIGHRTGAVSESIDALHSPAWRRTPCRRSSTPLGTRRPSRASLPRRQNFRLSSTCHARC